MWHKAPIRQGERTSGHGKVGEDKGEGGEGERENLAVQTISYRSCAEGAHAIPRVSI
jgi:hypothetical protein